MARILKTPFGDSTFSQHGKWEGLTEMERADENHNNADFLYCDGRGVQFRLRGSVE